MFPENGGSNLANKIRQWGAQNEMLSVLIGNTAQTTDQSALNISNKVFELVHQVTKTNMY